MDHTDVAQPLFLFLSNNLFEIYIRCNCSERKWTKNVHYRKPLKTKGFGGLFMLTIPVGGGYIADS